ncbi:MAG: iron-containing alcohol dehydrogenase, partial [Fervidobacterium sp.]
NPSCDLINKIHEEYKYNEIELVIGLGGGSSLDIAKALSGLLPCGGRIEEYIEGKKFTKRTKLVLIPSTAGTGSEVTNVGVYTVAGIKKPMTSDYFWADISVVDPELTYSMPPRITMYTGLDALTHAIESYWALSTQPYTEGLALRAAKMILESLEKSIEGEEWARNEMMIASTIAGVAFSQTRTTAAHAISFPLTSFYNIEHGLACALTLPELLLFNYEKIKTKMDEMLFYLGMTHVQELSSKIISLINKSGCSTKLKDYGVRKEDLEKIAQEAMKASIIKLTPRDIEHEDVLKILNRVYE